MFFSPYDILLNCFLKKSRRLPWNFSSRAYQKFHPDIIETGLSARKHYRKFGKKEGRVWNKTVLKGKSFDAAKPSIVVIADLKAETSSGVEQCIPYWAEKYNIVMIATCADPDIAHYKTLCCKIILTPTIDRFLMRRLLLCLDIQRVKNLAYVIVDYFEYDKIIHRLEKHAVPTIFMLNSRRMDGAYAIFRSLASASRLICSSQKMFDDLAYQHLWGYPDQVTFFPSGIIGDGGTIHKIKTDDFWVIGAGVADYFSGADFFIDIAARIKQRHKNMQIRFLWVELPSNSFHNRAYHQNLEHKIRHSRLENVVSFIRADRLTSDILRKADLFLDPSRYENAGNAGMQALAWGVPVLASDEASPLNGLLKEHNLADACLVHGHEVEYFCEKLGRLIESKAGLAEIRVKTALAGKSLMTVEQYAHAIDEIGCAAQKQLPQERKDANYLYQTKELKTAFWLDRSRPPRLSTKLARNYVRSWKSGTTPRKPFPGFHPGIYAEHHDLGMERVDPTVHYLQNRKPKGPWCWDVIKEQSLISDRALKSKLALHIHAYYPDMLEGMKKRLLFNKIKPDLFISVKNDADKIIAQDVFADYSSKVVIRTVPNRGRDIGPLLTEFGKELIRDYEIIGHLHTKKSLHIADRQHLDRWYRFLMHNLLGDGKSEASADTIIHHMVEDTQIGLVFPDDKNAISWAKNYGAALQLAPRLGIKHLPRFINFPVGTMFWARASVLEKFVALDLKWTDYPAEPLPIDGTMLHGIERLLAIICNGLGLYNHAIFLPNEQR